MRRVVVFGSTGMVGRAVVARLSALEGVELIGVNRSSHGFQAECPTDDVLGLLSGAAATVNCVGLLRSEPSYGTVAYQRSATLINSLWPQRLAVITADTGCRLIHLSTDAVFSASPHPADEDAPISANEVYGISKALGEVSSENVLNVRFSAIGPAPGRTPSLWEWLVRQPSNAIVPGYATFGWTGCTSAQLAWFVSDLVKSDNFNAVRSTGPMCHFVPNGTATKLTVLTMLARHLRPDVTVVAKSQTSPTSRVLSTSGDLRAASYTGTRGWSASINEAAQTS